MNTNLKSFVPVLVLTGIIAASAPFMRPAHSDTLVQRIEKLNALAQPARRAEVVILQGYAGSIYEQVSTNSYITGPGGFTLYNAGSSSGAPSYALPKTLTTDVYEDGKFHTTTYSNLTVNTQNMVEAIANLLSDGYEIHTAKIDSDNGWQVFMLIKR